MLAAGVCPAQGALTKPWDDLVAIPSANWIDPYFVNLYAANNANAYPVMFSTAKDGGGARGMNSLKFVDSADAHHISRAAIGGVDVLATGGVPFSEVLVVIAIDAASLPDNFALSMNGYACDPQADFVFYDGTAHLWGRPSGYYPAEYPGGTDPTHEQIAYSFSSGMVTALAFTPDALLGQTNPFTLDYAFENLPGKAVFSVYGWPDGGTEIYHTNRGEYDLNDPTRTVSTFEVQPLAGDANGDGVVNAADYIILKQHFGANTAAGAPDGDFDNDGDVDFGDLQLLIGGAGAGGAKETPEPASAMLLLFGAAAIVRRRNGLERAHG